GDTAGLVGVVGGRLAGVDLAEVAAPRALAAADEEGGLAILPALVDVGAAGLLAHGVQVFGLHERLQRGVLGAHLRARLDPLGLALDGRLGVAHLEPQQLATLPWGAHAGTAAGPFARLPARASSKRRTTSGTTWAGVSSRPSSRLIVVTPASRMPHGTIAR